MKKLILGIVLVATLITGCSRGVSQEEYDKLQESYNEKDKEIDELNAKINYYIYKSGIPTVNGEKIITNDASQAIHEILESLGSSINGEISNIIKYDTSYTFNITTEKNGIYEAIIFMDDEEYPNFITIYLNSEFCYCWNGLGNAIIDEEGWYIDGLSD